MNMIFEFLRERDEEAKRGGGESASPRTGRGRQQKLTGGKGKSGSSGRKRYQTDSRINTVVKSSYVRRSKYSDRKLRRQVIYLEHRERAEGESPRVFFDREHNAVDSQKVLDRLMEHQGEEVAFHKLILSPGDNDTNLKNYTRDVMNSLEKSLRCDLVWVGEEHRHTDHYHVHVLLAGKIPEQERHLLSSYLEGRDVHLEKEDFDIARQAGNEFLARERGLQRDLDRLAERVLDHPELYDRLLEDYLGLPSKWEDYKRAEEIGLGTSKADRELIKEFQTERDWGLDAIVREIRERFYRESSGSQGSKSLESDSWPGSEPQHEHEREQRREHDDLSDVMFDMAHEQADSPKNERTDSSRDERSKRRDDNERGEQ
jgi:hypothetical protein